MTEISVGIVGAGGIAQVAHLPVATRMEGVRVVALCDNDLNKARGLSDRFNVPDTYDDIEELLRYSRPDAVVICTPNHLHSVHVNTALSAGVHVLCERPLAMDVAGVTELINTSKLIDRVLMVGMNSRYRNDVQAVRQHLLNGELGVVRSVRAGMYSFRPSRNALGWRFSPARAGGGVMLDVGLPLMDLALFLAGGPRPLRVSAHYHWDEEVPEIEDSGCVLVQCEDGLSIFVDVSWRYLGRAEKFWFELLGSTGSASLSPLRIFAQLQGAPVDVSPSGATGRENQFTVSYKAEWANFLAAVRGDVQSPDLAQQLVSHSVLEAANRSAREGVDVTL